MPYWRVHWRNRETGEEGGGTLAYYDESSAAEVVAWGNEEWTENHYWLEGPFYTKEEAVMDYTINFDGGSLGNQFKNQRHGYGSYQLTTKDGRSSDVVQREFGKATSNIAEYKALIAALDDLLERTTCRCAHCTFSGSRPCFEPKQFAVEIRGDSNLVLHQVWVPSHSGPVIVSEPGQDWDEGVPTNYSKPWKTKPHLIPLRNQVRERLARFGSYVLVKVPRDESVDVLGH